MLEARSPMIVATSAVVDWAAGNDRRTAFVHGCLSRHMAGDWGSLSPDDRQANDDAARDREGRLVSSYPVPDDLTGPAGEVSLWVITDDLADPNTATTLLWPSDY